MSNEHNKLLILSADAEVRSLNPRSGICNAKANQCEILSLGVSGLGELDHKSCNHEEELLGSHPERRARPHVR